MKVFPWHSISSDTMSLEAVKKRYPLQRYRVKYDRYRSPTRFLMGGSSRTLWFVIKGIGVFSEDSNTGQELHIKSGEVIAFSSGSFFFETFGDEPFEFIKVLEIPEGCI